MSPDLLDRPRPFPLLDRSFDAVEMALARLGIEDPAELHSPLEVEQELSASALPVGTLLVFDREEVEGAYVDIRDTVMDERLGGAVYGTMARPPNGTGAGAAACGGGDVGLRERLRLPAGGGPPPTAWAAWPRCAALRPWPATSSSWPTSPASAWRW